MAAAAGALVRQSSTGNVSKNTDEDHVVFSKLALGPAKTPAILVVTMARPPLTSAAAPYWFEKTGVPVETMRMIKHMVKTEELSHSDFMFTDAYAEKDDIWSVEWEKALSLKDQQAACKRIQGILVSHKVDIVVFTSEIVHEAMVSDRNHGVTRTDTGEFVWYEFGESDQKRRIPAIFTYHPRKLGYSSTVEPKRVLVAVFDVLMQALKEGWSGQGLLEKLNAPLKSYVSTIADIKNSGKAGKEANEIASSPSWLRVLKLLQALGTDPLDWWLNHFIAAGVVQNMEQLVAQLDNKDNNLQLSDEELFVASGSVGRMELKSFQENYLSRKSTDAKHGKRGKADLLEWSTVKVPGYEKKLKMKLNMDIVRQVVAADQPGMTWYEIREKQQLAVVDN